MRIDGPDSATTLVLAHGAGAPMDSDFMNDITRLLNDRGIRVARFEFPYMIERRQTGKKRPPDRAPKLLDSYNAILDELGHPERLFIGGKSMGGRMATLVATQRPVAGVCVLGYPFHPPGKPDKLRLDHLGDIQCPTLICQGERDALGKREEVDGYDLPEAIQLHWLPDGDHSLKPRKASGHTLEENLANAADALVDFINRTGTGH
ncbi:alpha/beta fold hydrolase [Saccharospirillum salsuginis]|uniref:Alpha/beta hydrolase n=1 Tax=Saccharospirillum salsuginis TaxID=418750 RepID=A0A918NJZ9_9GAMM|nr:alpha/beta family hydrolase [Saccharospirillum salsuginis]GGX73358.1 alpha/beta hydrolase [Saccharospirillum salsuginis]